MESNTIYGSYGIQNNTSYFYSDINPLSNCRTIHGNYLANTEANLPMLSANLNERLIEESIDLNYLLFLQIILVIVSEMYIGIIGFSWLMSLIILMDKSSIIAILVYGFIINLMVSIMLTNINLSNQSNQQTYQSINQSNQSNQTNQTKLFDEITFDRKNLIWIILKLQSEKKLLILLFIIGLGCLFGPILYLLVKISWLIPLYQVINLFIGMIYLVEKINNVKTTDQKELYQTTIPFDMVKIISANTILIGLIELIYNESIRVVLLITLTNFILFYIYWCQIKTIIQISEEYYYYGNIDIFHCIFDKVITLCKAIKEKISSIIQINTTQINTTQINTTKTNN